MLRIDEPAALPRKSHALPAGDRPRTAPPWERRARDLLQTAANQVHLIGCATPSNLHSELARLDATFHRGQPARPLFRYEPAADHPALRRQLCQAAEQLGRRGPLGEVYAARAEELALELRLCHAAGRPGFAELARQRFAVRDRFAEAADELCARWLDGQPPVPEPGTRTRSDDETDPRSLLRRMRAELRDQGLQVRVVPSHRLAALAATGPGVIYVVAGRTLTSVEVERTVLHEVHGHSLPRQRAAQARLGIFACGTARGSDEQEGRALALEQDAGFLDQARRRELAWRHVAARAVEQGASFVETTERLAAHEVPRSDWLRIAARAHRGGGLARERVYLPALLRVRAARRRDPRLEAVLAAGRISLAAAGTLHEWLS